MTAWYAANADQLTTTTPPKAEMNFERSLPDVDPVQPEPIQTCVLPLHLRFDKWTSICVAEISPKPSTATPLLP
jgi:hypothetical protein